jgi:hypothetical protein
MIDNVAAALARNGVVVTAAPEFLELQYSLENMAMLVWRFLNRIYRTREIPAWFNAGEKPPNDYKNVAYWFPLSRIIYPGIEMPLRTVPGKKLYELAIKALNLPPQAQGPQFLRLINMFWGLHIAITYGNTVDTNDYKMGAAYSSRGTTFIMLPGAYAARGKIRIDPADERLILHEIRHSFSHYQGSAEWAKLADVDPSGTTFGDRSYYLRPEEIVARLAEIMYLIRNRITFGFQAIADGRENYVKQLKKPEARDPNNIESKRLSIIRRGITQDTERMRNILGRGEDRFLAFAEGLIRQKLPDLDAVIKEDAADDEIQDARSRLHKQLHELYQDLVTRYRNVIPGVRAFENMEPERYQHTRPAEVA